MPQDKLSACKHRRLCYEPSAHATKAGYHQVSAAELAAALGGVGMLTQPDPATFPAPLVLPGDALALEPSTRGDRQSLKSWDRLTMPYRSPDRRTIYVVPPPAVMPEVEHVQRWIHPNSDFVQSESSSDPDPVYKSPAIQDIIDYLAAFYHGLPVKIFPHSLHFSSWDETKSTRTPGYVGLNMMNECVRIRARTAKDNIFMRQLNLDDLLDAALSLLPTDALAILLLVDHDIYESEDDDFVCGRAYGGDRVAVVSMARYNPGLDAHQGVERHHAWPASHCEAYMQEVCLADLEESEPAKKKSKRGQKAAQKLISNGRSKDGALRAAVLAYNAFPSPLSCPTEGLGGMWLARVCQTASHEVGHCIGIGHCAYFACLMQGTASLVEDVGQPPYLCPVDHAKVQLITGATQEQHYRALESYCRRHPKVHMFSALAAWIRFRLAQP